MTSRERLATTLDHRQPDRVCLDLGATPVTGIHASALTRLRRAVLGDPTDPVKVHEPFQMLGEVDAALRAALGIDVIGVPPRKNMFATEAGNWRPWTLFDGTEVLIPGGMKISIDPESGDWLTYPEGDTGVPASARAPRGGYFFDAIIRQEPLDVDNLDVNDNLEEFSAFDAADVAYYQQAAAMLDEHPEQGAVLVIPGAGFGDIALVPATFLKHPKGIRDIKEWYISLVKRKDYVRAIFEHQCQIAEKNITTLIEIFADRIQVAMITGTDFGMQTGPMVSKKTYCELFQPFHRRINDLVHRNSSWKTFIHSCGGVYPLIPEFIAAGFDILNPVQCSATDMSAERLKAEFGDQLVFWGGGVDTQKTLATGTPDEVYAEVRERIRIFNQGGGFVFNTIHNIQGNVSIENMLAMYQAVKDSTSS